MTQFRYEPPPWAEAAACTGISLTVFFPDKGGTNAPAKRVCGRCPVREACLRNALDTGEEWGTWGGLSPKERRLLLDGRASA